MELFKMYSQKNWIICCFFNFLIACVFGLLMRYVYLFPLNFINYSFLLHAHSHVAMLGWVYMMVYVLIVHFFIPKEKSERPIYGRLFWCTEIAVIGMMVTFPVQGYALFSIIFSTMHIVLSYLFCRLVWKDSFKDKTPAVRFLKTAVLFMVLSTFGVWCLGPAVSTLGKQSAFYQIAIQFFLHFQFNGWFLFAVLALFLKQFQHVIEEQKFKMFYSLLVVSIFLTVAFPIRWFVENNILNWINILGVILQLFAFIYFYKMLKPQIIDFKANLNRTAMLFYSLALCSLFLKIGIQLLTIFPNIAEVSHQIRNFVIGFIHLTTLGIITGFLFGILVQNKMLSGNSSLMKNGAKCFILGYIATEVLLFFQGGLFFFGKGTMEFYYQSILIFSLLLVLGLVLMMMSIRKGHS
ncbi:hypothetical protein [Flavobacterium oncorhynchi]|nr:hypothetical protein [Flavobacterium oncorhynchi]